MGQHYDCSFDVVSTWVLDGSPEEIIQVFNDPMSLTRWWSTVFMRGEMISQGARDRVGLTARFYTKGLLPHTFQFTAAIEKVQGDSAMRIRTWGDFDGQGDISVTPVNDETHATIRWRVNVHQPYIRWLIYIFKPVFVANHRWAMRRGCEGLQAEIRRRRKAVAPCETPHMRPTFPHNLTLLQDRFRWTRESLGRVE